MLTSVLIVAACLAVLSLGFLWIFMLSAATAHPLYILGLVALPVTPVALVVVALLTDPGWWSVLIASVPILLATFGALLPSPSTRWSLVMPIARRRAASRPATSGHPGEAE